MLDQFKGIKTDYPIPYYFDQDEINYLASVLEEHELMLEILAFIYEWKNFPPEERSIKALHGPKAQIEHVRNLVKEFYDKRGILCPDEPE